MTQAHISDSRSAPDWKHAWTQRRGRWRRRRPVILLAEDDAADQELVRRTMNEFPAPCDLRIVSNGVELLEYFTVRRNRDGVKSNPVPDLIILDLNMPGMDGRQAIRKLRGAQFDATIPVIVFSTSDSAKDISDSYRAGCNSYVIKPTDLEHFNQVLAMITFYWLEVAALP